MLQPANETFIGHSFFRSADDFSKVGLRISAASFVCAEGGSERMISPCTAVAFTVEVDTNIETRSD